MDTYSPLLWVHIIAGGVGLSSGFLALFAPKGRPVHRASGNLFFVSMLIMAVSGGHIAFNASVMITVIAACTTFYFVSTSWLTVMRAEIRARLENGTWGLECLDE